MITPEELLNKAREELNKAIKLLEEKDFYNAAEKAWKAVELTRKALLITVNVPHEKAKTITYGYPLFSRLLRALNQRKLLEKYGWFESTLHARGFYEEITPIDEITEAIQQVRSWINSIEELIKQVKGINLIEAVSILEEITNLRRKILRMNIEYIKLNEKLNTTIKEAIKTTKSFS